MDGYVTTVQTDNSGVQYTQQLAGQAGNVQPYQQAGSVSNPVQVSGVSPTTGQALFTQEQINSIVANRVNPLNQRVNDLSSRLAQAEQLSQSYLTELTCLKQKETARKSGVPDQFVDFAVFEASKLAVNGKTFETAIQEYVAANRTLFGLPSKNGQATSQTQTPTGQTATQVPATPAQTTPAQVQQQTVNNQTAVTTAGSVNTATQAAPATQGAGVQFGQTGAQGVAGNITSSGAIDTEVQNFLKARGLMK